MGVVDMKGFQLFGNIHRSCYLLYRRQSVQLNCCTPRASYVICTHAHTWKDPDLMMQGPAEKDRSRPQHLMWSLMRPACYVAWLLSCRHVLWLLWIM